MLLSIALGDYFNNRCFRFFRTQACVNIFSDLLRFGKDTLVEPNNNFPFLYGSVGRCSKSHLPPYSGYHNSGTQSQGERKIESERSARGQLKIVHPNGHGIKENSLRHCFLSSQIALWLCKGIFCLANKEQSVRIFFSLMSFA